MSRKDPAPTTLPEPIRAVLDLFAGPLVEVRFPDIDHERLSEAASVVEQRREQLQLALEAVQRARETLESAQRELEQQARRAHAYASIYAQTDPELAERLAAIKLEARKLAPKKKRRPRKPAGKQQTNIAVAEDAA